MGLYVSKVCPTGGMARLLLKLKKVFSWFSTISVILLLILAVLLAGVRLVGIQPYMVLSGSMEPTYHVGSMIYVISVDPMDLQAGDPLTYRLNGETVVTHRIVERVDTGSGGYAFRTKGDANLLVDGALVKPEHILGKPVISIPYLGFVANFVQKPPGIYLVIAFCMMLLIFPAFLDSLIALQKEREEQRSQPPQE